MRLNLKVFRIKHKLTQAKFAEKVGVSRQNYRMIEKGERSGDLQGFWNSLQKSFNVPDEKMFALTKIEEGEKDQCEETDGASQLSS